jgi:hypothetical protein
MSDSIRKINNPKLSAEIIAELESRNAVLLDPDFLDAAIINAHDGRAVYDYNMVVEAFAEHAFSSEDDPLEVAAEWVSFNTLRALPYAGPQSPIVVFELEEDDGEEGDDLNLGGKLYRAV